jgi:hypothetical protein
MAGRSSSGSDQFEFLEEIRSDWIGLGSDRIGSIYMLCFFLFLIDFDWIKSHLINLHVVSGRI